MRLDRLEVFPYRFPLGVRNARQVFAEREGVFLRLHAGSISGMGELAPLPGFSPDTLAESLSFLAARSWPWTLDLETVSAAVPASLPALRFALETALLDLRARAAGLSLHRALDGAESTLALAALIDGPEAAQAAAQAGYAALKLKVGGGSGDLARVDRVRAAAPGCALRLDANGILPPAWAPLLAKQGLEFVEEPGPLAPGHGLRIACDESLLGVGPGALSFPPELYALVLKPALLGGLLHCRALAAAAQAADRTALVSHLFDGPIARASAAALARALPPHPADGLGFHAGLRFFGVTEQATLPPPNTPGLVAEEAALVRGGFLTAAAR